MDQTASPAARAPEAGAFARDTQVFRPELLAHCYRMLGSVDDAEDLVQETYLRAWRAYGQFESRSSVRTWLYRIATNACLSAMEHRKRRELPSGLGGPSGNPESPPVPAGPEVSWLQPIPDALVAHADDPAAAAVAREGLRLALIASLQHLPARQRAVLILRDVLAFSAVEVAEILDTTPSAVKSALQRARARLDQIAPVADDVVEPTEPAARAALERYIAAFEAADPAALRQLLRDDATLEAAPLRAWFAGLSTCLAFLTAQVLGPGNWRMFPTSANGQPAAVGYRRDENGTYRAYGVVVLTVTSTGIGGINSFGDPGLVATFGLPPTPPDTE